MRILSRSRVAFCDQLKAIAKSTFAVPNSDRELKGNRITSSKSQPSIKESLAAHCLTSTSTPGGAIAFTRRWNSKSSFKRRFSNEIRICFPI